MTLASELSRSCDRGGAGCCVCEVGSVREDRDERDCEGGDGTGVREDEVSAMDWDDGDGAKVSAQEPKD